MEKAILCGLSNGLFALFSRERKTTFEVLVDGDVTVELQVLLVLHVEEGESNSFDSVSETVKHDVEFIDILSESQLLITTFELSVVFTKHGTKFN